MFPLSKPFDADFDPVKMEFLTDLSKYPFIEYDSIKNEFKIFNLAQEYEGEYFFKI